MKPIQYILSKTVSCGLLLILASTHLFSEDQKSNEAQCISVNERLHIMPPLGLSKQKLLKTLGKPKRTNSLGYDEDDGGRAKLTLYEYKTVAVILIRGEVDEVRYKKTGTGISEVIRVGNKWAKIRMALGPTANQAEQPPTEELTLMPSCNYEDDPNDFFVYLTFNKGLLKQIRVAVDRP